MLTTIILTLFPLLMIYAALSDVLTMTIANWISVALVFAFCALSIYTDMHLAEFAMHASCAVTVLVVTFIMFAKGWIGGGDAKLASATSLWMGWSNMADYSMLFALLGGVLTLIIIYLRFAPLPSALARHAWIARLHNKANGVPYGLALASAGLIVYPETTLWLAVAMS